MLILLDEELTSISGKELLARIKEIRNFNTPVILLTKDNNYEYNVNNKTTAVGLGIKPERVMQISVYRAAIN